MATKYLGQDARVGGAYNLNVMVASGIGQAIRRSNDLTSKQLAVLGEAFAKRGTIPADMRRRAHQAIGQEAQNAVLSAYDSRRHAAHTAAYRAGMSGFREERNKRYAGGALRSALASPNFYDASANGVKLVNERWLNATAKQWHRLNFGTGGGSSSSAFPITWGGLANVALRLDEGTPSRANVLPAGYFLGGQFTPLGETEGPPPPGARIMKRRRTRPIQPANFLDAGVEAIARELPIQYTALYERLYRNVFIRRDIEEALNVKMPRPLG